MINKLLPLPLLLLLLLAVACKDDTGETQRVDFDEAAMLDNYGSNILLPGYAFLQQKTQDLQSRVADFTAAPTEASLLAVQQAHQQAWLAWQGINLYEFGPAEQLNLRRNISTFPTQYPKIINAVQSGSWDVNGLYANDIRGFAALDFLLYSENGDGGAILERFTTSTHAANWKAFLTDVSQHLHAQTSELYQQWSPTGGNYLGTFITNTGNSASSSLSLLVNQLVQGFEQIKNKKIREPLGLMAIDGQPVPRAVEAYYSSYSLPLILANLQAVENMVEGTYASGEGLGLADYLEAHHAAGNTQTNLAEEIRAQLQLINAKVAAIPAPLHQAVLNQPQLVNEAYTEMVNLMPLIKADLPSALSVRIEDYGDTDGD
ncbi:imelysin family protein [Cesiribacter andamanensis]|uniref:Putative periplasmic lipoprotein n=1 Tax=Cesiribacter andamanensis AMV16 TaxID=1279009 RepID=M7N6C8_9BACT|nr:imelysin family protein [Cesiribacter andamanensis]EMR04183.1 putative periplasmic lipoprotein [Cesiribacter andamanensis AMV16]